jgi:hypothetical protein
LCTAQNLGHTREIMSFAPVDQADILPAAIDLFDLTSLGEALRRCTGPHDTEGHSWQMLQRYQYNVNASISQTRAYLRCISWTNKGGWVHLANRHNYAHFPDVRGQCVLRCAELSGHTYIVEHLLQCDDTQVGIADSEHRLTTLGVAVVMGHARIVRHFLGPEE